MNRALWTVQVLLALFFVPESLRWLAKGGRDREALDILTRVNGSVQASCEFEEIRGALVREEGSFAELLRPGLRTALLVGVTLAALGQVSGINSIIYIC